MELDLNLRVRVAELEAHLSSLARPGLLETSPGVRSVTIEYDQRRLPLAELLRLLEEADAHLPLARPAVRALCRWSETVFGGRVLAPCWQRRPACARRLRDRCRQTPGRAAAAAAWQGPGAASGAHEKGKAESIQSTHGVTHALRQARLHDAGYMRARTACGLLG